MNSIFLFFCCSFFNLVVSWLKEVTKKFSELNTFGVRNSTISSTSFVRFRKPLWIGHGHFCMQDYMSMQSLNFIKELKSFITWRLLLPEETDVDFISCQVYINHELKCPSLPVEFRKIEYKKRMNEISIFLSLKLDYF